MSCGDNEIDKRAADWVARLDRLEMGASACPELQQWLAQDPRHKGAFLRAQSSWVSTARIAPFWPMSDRVQAADSPLPRMRRRTVIAGFAATAVSASIILAVLFRQRPILIETPIGEIRRVPLGDGSLAAVNTNSALSIVMSRSTRDITLDRGEAWFDVAKDAARPFLVSIGKIRVRATGTAFSVRRRRTGVDVLVTDGAVETWLSSGGVTKSVPAGSKIFVSDLAGPSEIIRAAAEIERALAWRSGEIVLEEETLAEAAAEFNRYNMRELSVDPAIANMRLVGWFRTNEPETFAAAASVALGIAVIANEREIYLGPTSGSKR